jgi:Xaa-Pro aminopeptidase
MLALTRAKFLYGTTGNNLDILARGPLWDMDIDYQCGTGHGVGHVLSVHEGPQYIGWGFGRRRSAPLEPGMVTSNEPGVYLPHELGIRTENELLVVKGTKNFYGQFLGFETLTWVPIDLDAVDPDLLSTEEKDQLNQYHAMVYEKISPFLNQKEKAWLKQATRKLA